MSPIREAQAPTPVCYTVGAAGSSGVWLGVGATRVAVLAVGLLAGILALTAGYPSVVALAPVLAGVVLAAARVAGRPLLDWVGPVGGHHAAAVAGAARWRAALPTLHTDRSGVSGPVSLRLPAEYGRLRVVSCVDDPSIGVVTDSSARTVTVVFDVCGVDRFPLLDAAERDTLIAGWGDALAVLADTDDALVRLQLIERVHPNPASDMPAVSRVDTGEWRAEIAAFATCHDSRLALQWVFPRLHDTALATVAGRCQLAVRSLLSARLVARPLSATEVGADIAFTLTGTPCPASSVGAMGPVCRRSQWTQVATDDRVHRSFAVSGWPSAPVSAAWLSPLVLSAPGGMTRTVSLHLERVAPPAAARLARTRRAKAELDQSDRARFGMTSSAALDAAQASGTAMDAELAAGYRTHRLAGLVTLSADSIDALDDAGRMLRQAAAVCRLELRPLHGQHDTALAATVPLCRLRSRGQA